MSIIKIAVFENEYETVRSAFETANLLEFDNSLSIDVFATSQELNIREIESYSVVFVDISLSPNSKLDGFGIIRKIKEINDKFANKIVILTGNDKIKDAMKARKIEDNRITIVIKPVDCEEISDSIKKIIT